MNPKLKSALMFGVAVVATLAVIKLIQKYVLPKAPAAVRNVAEQVLPNT